MVFPRTEFLKFAYNLAQNVHTTRTFNDWNVWWKTLVLSVGVWGGVLRYAVSVRWIQLTSSLTTLYRTRRGDGKSPFLRFPFSVHMKRVIFRSLTAKSLWRAKSECLKLTCGKGVVVWRCCGLFIPSLFIKYHVTCTRCGWMCEPRLLLPARKMSWAALIIIVSGDLMPILKWSFCLQ